MRTSVIIPAYNCAATIEATLESVLQQTLPADEILVMDDGSTDNTASILNSFRPRVTVFRQPNQGVASARNALCVRAQGDLIAFLDHDDIWHPTYLALQREVFESRPRAVASFAGHVNFGGYDTYRWPSAPQFSLDRIELLEPLAFYTRYNQTPGLFASMSYFCIPKEVLRQIGSDPFPVSVSGADDFFVFNALPLLGPVAYIAAPAVAYRITDRAHSANLVRAVAWSIRAFELLEKRYEETAGNTLRKVFQMAFTSRRRGYAKLLMGAGDIEKARDQLRRSIRQFADPVSLAKSASLLSLSYLPTPIQPTWPSANRQWHPADEG
jgi:glycosyltransferase involved in cell wall biosynthesis